MVKFLYKKWLGVIIFLIYKNKIYMEKIRKKIHQMIKATKKGDVELELKYRAELTKLISTHLK